MHGARVKSDGCEPALGSGRYLSKIEPYLLEDEVNVSKALTYMVLITDVPQFLGCVQPHSMPLR